jgi:hypothetical protein
MTDVLWVIVGIFIGGFCGLFTAGLLSSGKTEDLYTEIQDLRIQRQLLKEEIFRLSQPKSKPTPRKKRKYKPRNKKR